MSKDFLQQKIQCLLDCMKSQSYSATSMNLHRRQLKWAEEYCAARGDGKPSAEDVDDFVAVTLNLHPKEDARQLRRTWRLLADFCETEVFHSQRYRYGDATLCSEFQTELDLFRQEMEDSGLAEGSVGNLVHGVHSFLAFLEKDGCRSVQEIRHSHLNDYIMSAAPSHMGNISNVTWPLNRFFLYLQKQGSLPFNRKPQFPHPVCRRKKALPCMDDSETSAILEAINTDTVMGKRDYAIILTAVHTGMRISDIFALELSSIDWAKKEISFVQKKTGTENILPLPVGVGNAIADYILNGRPRSSSQNIFLSTRAPYQPIGASGNRTRIIHKYQKAAGIERKAYDGKGFHAFRRGMGTKMLEAGVPITTVSQTLGHRSPLSAKRYLSLDVGNLMECCLDISVYKTVKEGLS